MGMVKIRITENQVLVKRGPDGNDLHHPLRSWDVEFEGSALQEGWNSVHNDLYHLLEHLRYIITTSR